MKNITKLFTMGLLAMIFACSPEEFEETPQDSGANLELNMKSAGVAVIEGNRVTYRLDEADVPGIKGYITLRDAGIMGVEAFIRLENTIPGVMHPVHIHKGLFGQNGDRAKTLNPVNGDTGISQTYFSQMDNGEPAIFDDLVNNHEYYVGPHYSMDDMDTVIAVGNIGTSNPPDTCSDCSGGLDRLAFQYNGDATARVTVKESGTGKVLYDAHVNPEEQFTVVGQNSTGTLGDKIHIYVNNCKVATIKTNCQEEIGIGYIDGDFEVVDGNSVLGGPLCDVPEEPTPECGDCEGTVNYLSFEYTGSHPAKITIKQSQDYKYVFHNYVKPGEIIKVYGKAHDGSFGRELKTYINFICKDNIDTSCDKAIGPGSKFGYLTVVEGTSTKGGELCEVSADEDDVKCNNNSWYHKHTSECYKKDKKPKCGNNSRHHKHNSKCYKKQKKCKNKSRHHKHSSKCS